MDILHAPSPNYNQRKRAIDMLVLHYTGMQTGEDALARMLDEAAEVSAHYMVWEDGRVLQLVDDAARAWHAGVSCWQGVRDINSRSIGIEIVNGGHDWPRADGTLPPYPEAQIERVIELCRALMARHEIAPTHLLAHSDIAPARKIDPGEHFPWAKLAKAGIGIWPDIETGIGGNTPDAETLLPGDTGNPVRALQETLAEIGYEVVIDGAYDEALRFAILAFQRRFLPYVLTGHACAETRARLVQIRDAYSASSAISSFQA